jgi:hypothetical protein
MARGRYLDYLKRGQEATTVTSKSLKNMRIIKKKGLLDFSVRDQSAHL